CLLETVPWVRTKDGHVQRGMIYIWALSHGGIVISIASRCVEGSPQSRRRDMQPTAIRNTASLKASFAFLLLLLGVSGQVPMARAQSLGTFRPTGSMILPRNFHTATLLLDGRVL